MLQAIKTALKTVPGLQPAVRRIRSAWYKNRPLDSECFIQTYGHRAYTGELAVWEEIARLQYDFLIAHGLKPEHHLLDVACGCLRLGARVIPYLDAGHYAGIDRMQTLIDAGIDHELGREVYDAKRPLFICNGDFDFSELNGFRPDFAWSHSLFTHLIPESIERCLRNLRGVIADQGVYYTTFWETTDPREMRKNWKIDHPFGGGTFTQELMERFGRNTGWRFEYIGKWGHPLGQVIVRYRAA
jgi:hypothetical protein